MAKTLSSGVIDVPGVGEFSVNALPDPFDARDLEYRPKLEPLPSIVDQRSGRASHRMLKQVGQSCTGHALAAVIETVLARPAPGTNGTNGTSGARRPVARRGTRVSPYMLYRLARRYDEFPGEADAGSSLRGAFKGWFHHGVALSSQWPTLELEDEPDLDSEGNLTAWRERPLGAFYRVNPFRLDDVQSAITELYGIAVSAAIHDGWRKPAIVRKGSRTLHVIQRPVDAKGLGGHAFAIVGYNEVGFLVQNSWGPEWGRRGFATLPYDDWFDSVYDAWVARPGVPHTPFYRGRTRTGVATGGELATGTGPDLRRLALHVVNLGNDGRLSAAGKFASTPAQIERVFDHMAAWHAFWLARGSVDRRHVVLYAHGGGVDEQSGLEIAQRQLNWWLNNGIYPISFAWQTGPAETLINAIVDMARDALPFGGIGFDLVEQFDRFVEGKARTHVRWLWDETKENARAASERITDPGAIRWPPTSSSAATAMALMPGASLVIDRLARPATAPVAKPLVIHLVGHSAGAVLQAAMLERLEDKNLRVDTLSWMAPAITVSEFAERAYPHLGGAKPTVRRFTAFNLSDSLELDDSIGAQGFDVYHKSILFLVARALETLVPPGATERAMLGMTRFWDDPFDGKTLLEAIRARGGSLVVSRSADPPDGRSDATRHIAFDEDTATMTSIAMRARGATTNPDLYRYEPHAALRDAAGAPWSPGLAVVPAGGAAEPAPRAAETAPPGDEPIQTTAAPQYQRPEAPRSRRRAPIPEVAVAPRTSSPILDVLQSAGWRIESNSKDGDSGGRRG